VQLLDQYVRGAPAHDDLAGPTDDQRRAVQDGVLALMGNTVGGQDLDGQAGRGQAAQGHGC
jgi:hypothetical protein